jgi:hypothetical protein
MHLFRIDFTINTGIRIEKHVMILNEITKELCECKFKDYIYNNSNCKKYLGYDGYIKDYTITEILPTDNFNFIYCSIEEEEK